MDVLHSCRCCLRRNPDRGLMTIYTHFDRTEIYSDMLRDCFNIHLPQGAEECGICELCIERLRNAHDFKLQVQHSQEELQRALLMKSKELSALLEKRSPVAASNKTTLSPLNSLDGVFDSTHDSSYGRQTYHQTFENEEGPRSERRTHKHVTEKTRNPTRTSQVKKTYICDTCHKCFTLKNSLIKHLSTHSEEEKLFCRICGNSFTHQSYLKRHYLIHHGKKRYSYLIRQKQAVQEFNLHSHLKEHTRKKKFSCETCLKEFTKQYNLNIHKRVHTRDKPYTCEVCKKNSNTSVL